MEYVEFISCIVGGLFLSCVLIDLASSQFVQQSQMGQFRDLKSEDGFPACSVNSVPYRSYAVSRITSCTYDCMALKRQTGNLLACVGFNFFNKNGICQLFTTGQRLYFAVRSDCAYFMNVEVVGSNKCYPVCPSSFTFDSQVSGCYKSVKANVDWNSAALYCQRLVTGGHLVFINSNQENAAMSPLTADKTGCNGDGWFGTAWWIGLQFRDPNVNTGPFYWKFNVTTVALAMTYTNWKSGEPTNLFGNEHCVEVIYSILEWNDMSCSTSLCFICELDL